MEEKKSKRAELEKKSGLFIEIGILFSLALIFVFLELTSRPGQKDYALPYLKFNADEEIVPITFQEAEKPPPPPSAPQVLNVIKIVENDATKDKNPTEIINAGAKNDFVAFGENEGAVNENEVFDFVEEMPKFKGGPKDNFRNFIIENLHYPQYISQRGIGGRVLARFTINERGEVLDVEIVKGVGPELDNEVIRVIKSSPLWTPGKHRGRPVKVQFNFPIVFVISKP